MRWEGAQPMALHPPPPRILLWECVRGPVLHALGTSLVRNVFGASFGPPRVSCENGFGPLVCQLVAQFSRTNGFGSGARVLADVGPNVVWEWIHLGQLGGPHLVWERIRGPVLPPPMGSTPPPPMESPPPMRSPCEIAAVHRIFGHWAARRPTTTAGPERFPSLAPPQLRRRSLHPEVSAHALRVAVVVLVGRGALGEELEVRGQPLDARRAAGRQGLEPQGALGLA